MTLEQICESLRVDIASHKRRVAELTPQLNDFELTTGDKQRLYKRITQLNWMISDMQQSLYTLEHYYEEWCICAYPELESWNEFYPNEIFIAITNSDTEGAYLPVLKKAKIGTTIVLGENCSITTTYKKVGDIEDGADINSSLIILGEVARGAG